jgi:hypothetical protein
MTATTQEQTRVLAVGRFNSQLVIYLLVYLLVAGLSSGYTLVSPSTSWLLYVATARLTRQHRYLQRTSKLKATGQRVAPAAVTAHQL